MFDNVPRTGSVSKKPHDQFRPTDADLRYKEIKQQNEIIF